MVSRPDKEQRAKVVLAGSFRESVERRKHDGEEEAVDSNPSKSFIHDTARLESTGP